MQYAATYTTVRATARRGCAARERRTLDRSRITAHVIVGVLLASALLVTLASLAHDPEAPLPASWGTVSVSQNATLWSIAEAHPVEGRSTVDTVELIAAENNLADCTIHAGQVLRVPASQPSLVLVQR